jgi:hypothetical protein
VAILAVLFDTGDVTYFCNDASKHLSPPTLVPQS